jgi:hypothetical protein
MKYELVSETDKCLFNRKVKELTHRSYQLRGETKFSVLHHNTASQLIYSQVLVKF